MTPSALSTQFGSSAKSTYDGGNWRGRHPRFGQPCLFTLVITKMVNQWYFWISINVYVESVHSGHWRRPDPSASKSSNASHPTSHLTILVHYSSFSPSVVPGFHAYPSPCVRISYLPTASSRCQAHHPTSRCFLCWNSWIIVLFPLSLQFHLRMLLLLWSFPRLTEVRLTGITYSGDEWHRGQWHLEYFAPWSQLEVLSIVDCDIGWLPFVIPKLSSLRSLSLQLTAANMEREPSVPIGHETQP
ncbi:hypothetical protein BDV98DRAFT_193898 [Pterulicium gracile]|uniref:F-box domain-containing protein n=1 Tax=Pterulicium gracile TaxID=1884261 RepID=A0A5C3Q9L2_9AGAR|nr:hypothetical protein BDV98DRAFT_193898 [Pterula gracilis]